VEERGGTLWNNVHSFFIEPVKKMSGGRIDMECFTTGEVMPGKQYRDAIARGVVEIGIVPTCWHPDEIGHTVQFAVPGGLRDNADWQRFYRDYGFGKYIQEKALTPLGLKDLGPLVEVGPLLGLREPIGSLADLKGLNLSCVGAAAKIFDALGANVVTIDPGERYTGLATGVIDGAITGGLNCTYDRGYHEVCKLFMLEPAVKYSSNDRVIMNLELWENLPDDLQEILHQAVIAFASRYWEAMVYQQGEIAAKVKAAGVSFYEPSEDDIASFRIAVDGVWVELLEDPLDAEPLRMLRDYMVKMGYVEE